MNFLFKLSVVIVVGVVFSVFNSRQVIAAQITYDGAGFTEAGANDGSVTGSVIVTLFGDVFQDSDNDNLLDIDTEVIIDNVPAGLTPVVTLATSSTTTEPTSEPTAWTAATAAEPNAWSSVAYGNGLFVAVSSGGTNRVMYSADGINWTPAAAAEQNYWLDVTYGNGIFVAVAFDGTNRVMYSADGINWTPAAAAEQNSWFSVTYGNGLFVATSEDGTSQVMYSADAITWTSASSTQSNDWRSVTYGNGLFVSVSLDGVDKVMYSADGINWTPAAAAEQNSWVDVTYGNGLFVAISYNGTSRVMYSADGINWTSAAATEQRGWNRITYGNGLFVALSYDGTNQVMYSADAINWTSAVPTDESSWNGIVYGNGRFVTVSGSNLMYSSGFAPDKIATLTFTGSSTAHESLNSVSDLTFTFTNNAFVFATSAANVSNATGPASSGRGITFTDAPVVASNGGNGGIPRYCDDPNANNYKPEGKGKALNSLCQYNIKLESTDRDKLLAQISQLRAQLATLQRNNTKTTCTFTRTLKFQMSGEDVRCLQTYLNTHGFLVATTGPGAPNFETTYFGLATQSALIKFQETNASAILTPLGLTKGSGYFGERTRKFVNEN